MLALLHTNSLKRKIMKKLSLLIAGIITFSAASFAQGPAKAKPAQEPVKVAPAANTAKADRVPAATSQPAKATAATPATEPAPARTSTQAAPAKRKLVKKQVVQKSEIKAVPRGDAKVK
jgi:hypothetical protein